MNNLANLTPGQKVIAWRTDTGSVELVVKTQGTVYIHVAPDYLPDYPDRRRFRKDTGVEYHHERPTPLEGHLYTLEEWETKREQYERVAAIQVQTRMVPEKFIIVHLPEKRNAYDKEKIDYYEQDVKISMHKLWAFFEHEEDRWDDPAFIEFSPKAQDAIVLLGWGIRATRGGVWPTTEFLDWMTANAY